MPDYKISFARDERVLFQDLVHAVDDQAALEAARKMAADPLRLFSHREMNGDGEASIQDPVLIVDRIDLQANEFDDEVYSGPPSDAHEIYSDQLLALARELAAFNPHPDLRESALQALIRKARKITGKEAENA